MYTKPPFFFFFFFYKSKIKKKLIEYDNSLTIPLGDAGQHPCDGLLGRKWAQSNQSKQRSVYSRRVDTPLSVFLKL